MSQPVPDLDNLPVSEFLCFAAYAVNGAFGRAYRPLLERLGLTYPQYLVMTALWDEDGQTVGAIGQRLFLESNTLTPLLKRLEAQGLVARERSREDERQVVVRLAPAGEALRAEGRRVPGCMADLLGMDLGTLTRMRDELLVLRERLAAVAAE